jgi:hypothetical protein
MESMLRVVCRTSNRFFVDLPLCENIPGVPRQYNDGFPIGRDPDYLQLSMQFTIDVMKTAVLLNFFPPILRP